MKWIRNSLIVVVALGVLWAMLAGIGGYQLGTPSALDGPSCYHVLHVDFVVPMWKTAPATECVSATAAPAQAPASTPAPAICDDPNAPADGNVSGEQSCP